MSARILIVDDVPASTWLLKARLNASYYHVDTAADGLSAIEAVATATPDLILLDLSTPERDGLETCRRLKADMATRHIPVVMLTAVEQADERVKALESGADDFLTNPLDFETLLARVRGLVRFKRLRDEWRLRARTVEALGLSDGFHLTPAPAGRRALAIDDQEPWLRHSRDTLAHDGWVVSTSEDTASTLAWLDQETYDLILLSLSLATEDPLRLMSRLQVDPRTADVPCLIVAERNQRNRLLTGLEMGASDWLLRPIDADELRARARNQVRRKRHEDQLRAELSDALQLAVTDPLTGLHNRRYLMRHLANLLRSATGPDTTVLMIDVDHFKSINDQWGHRAGDRVLGHIAETLQDHVRVFDTLARYGGDEFVVVMPCTGLDEATIIAEQMRRAIEAASFRPDEPTPTRLTVSVGLAAAESRVTTAEQLLHSADQALYRAKRAGRNRTIRAAEVTA